GSGHFADSNLLLNAMLPVKVLPVNRHPRRNEIVELLCGKDVEVTYDDGGNELERVCMDASAGIFGCVVPAGAWHTVEVLEPSVIMEVKDGRYGEDGSESFFNNR
ncbi:MAG: WbuC family cupin fold metalloprotein, partial [Bacteroidales bacterium]|nr:WbuC family cupin fold metalloprotein [Bacteroidales bacterium]